MGHGTVNSKLDIITRIRGEVMGSRVPTGENLFLAWGYPTAIVLLLEFVALKVWNEYWLAVLSVEPSHTLRMERILSRKSVMEL